MRRLIPLGIAALGLLLDASVPGDGTIIYAGNPPDITRSITGTGAITTTS